MPCNATHYMNCGLNTLPINHIHLQDNTTYAWVSFFLSCSLCSFLNRKVINCPLRTYPEINAKSIATWRMFHSQCGGVLNIMCIHYVRPIQNDFATAQITGTDHHQQHEGNSFLLLFHLSPHIHLPPSRASICLSCSRENINLSNLI